jgi:hypothetical protein
VDRAFKGSRGSERQGAGAWRLAGDDGSSWTESTSVRPIDGKGSAYLVTMSVVRVR